MCQVVPVAVGHGTDELAEKVQRLVLLQAQRVRHTSHMKFHKHGKLCQQMRQRTFPSRPQAGPLVPMEK